MDKRMNEKVFILDKAPCWPQDMQSVVWEGELCIDWQMQ